MPIAGYVTEELKTSLFRSTTQTTPISDLIFGLSEDLTTT